jgi:hypothetical protein
MSIASTPKILVPFSKEHQMTENWKRCVLLTALAFTASLVFAQWKDISILENESVWATSSLVETLGNRQVEYGPEALFDGDLSTSWVEGVDGPGVGESVLILLQRPVEEIRLINGFASSPDLYLKNNRIKSVTITLYAGLTAPGMVSENDYYLYKTIETVVADNIPIADTREEQKLYFPLTIDDQYELYLDAITLFQEDEPFLFSMICDELGVDEENTGIVKYNREVMEYFGFFGLRLTINDVYPGSMYDDSCISEIAFELGEF